MNENSSLSSSYSVEGAYDIRDAFRFVGFECVVGRDGFLEAQIGDQVLRVMQDDNMFEVLLLDENRMVAGNMLLTGSFATSMMLAAVIVEVAK